MRLFLAALLLGLCSTHVATAASPPPGSPSWGEDPHWIDPDDYFINVVAGRMLWVGKKVRAPRAQAGTPAEFVLAYDGERVSTEYFNLTRPARAEDLKLYEYVLYFTGNRDDAGVYRPPKDRETARAGLWEAGPLGPPWAKDIVNVLGQKVDVKNTRVPQTPPLKLKL